MVKPGKNEIAKRIAISRAILVEMEVLREHLSADVSDLDKVNTITRFCEAVVCTNIMNIEDNKNAYTWYHNGSIE
jgi:hypothetical protein